MSPQDRSLFAERERAVEDPLAIEIDASRIAPESWQPVDLAALGAAQPSGHGIEARFGVAALGPMNDNRDAGAELAPVALSEVEAPQSVFISAPPANDDLTPSRPLRIIRRRSLAELAENARTRTDDLEERGDAEVIEPPAPPPDAAGWETLPQQVKPLPFAGPIAWQTLHSIEARPQRLDRSAVNALIVIMIGAWAVGMGFAIYKLSVPGSGAAIQWRS